MNKRKTDKNTVEKMVLDFQNQFKPIGLPFGVRLETEEEQAIWDAFTRARAKDDWRSMDLILLSKVVKLEYQIRQHTRELDKIGVIMENKRGTPIVNPLVSIIDTFERRQLAVIRSMSLNQTYSDPRDLNLPAKDQNKLRALVDKNSPESLLATPN